MSETRSHQVNYQFKLYVENYMLKQLYVKLMGPGL